MRSGHEIGNIAKMVSRFTFRERAFIVLTGDIEI